MVVEISFSNKKMQKLFSTQKAMTKQWGPGIARKTAQRLMELQLKAGFLPWRTRLNHLKRQFKPEFDY
jgi:hypothetical protein